MTAHIIAAKRSPVAPRGGALSRLTVHELGAPVLLAALADAGLSPEMVDEVIVGNALGAGGNPARMIALAAGLPERVAGLSIDRQCCGGLDALILGAALIASGQAQVAIAGGAESYSRRPIRLRTDPDGGDPVAYDRPPFVPFADRDPEMDAAADTLAQETGITQGEQDAWAVRSHARALAADHSAEILPLNGLDRDAFARNLRPALAARAPRLCGTISAANAAVAADGAAFVVMVSDAIAQGLPDAGMVYRAGATLGDRPDMPGTAPIAAIRNVLHQADVPAGALHTAEIMEAYAIQALACIRGAGIDPEIVNRGGGALARGHPIGASGAINAVRLFHELRNTGGTGIAAIAAAGGLGTAVLMSR
ncbi:thiolase family protein [Donghicola sp. XS_ASV15]|uniref:thiolase family protein n=1 Tax=Donghicola sp. XS_ASV15 TaxID=3241295 RepID=UPI003519082A